MTDRTDHRHFKINEWSSLPRDVLNSTTLDRGEGPLISGTGPHEGLQHIDMSVLIVVA